MERRLAALLIHQDGMRPGLRTKTVASSGRRRWRLLAYLFMRKVSQKQLEKSGAQSV
jgi:hypothetical protein